jgi:aminoglycoside phosphotransferase (APT) family kinase protein
MTGAAFTDWVEQHTGLQGASLGVRLGGGNSNVTQLVSHAGGSAVLRRPPDNAISASAANGVRREHRMLQALHGRAPVPRALGFCEDASVVGQPFLLVEHVDGVSITTAMPEAYGRDPGTLRALGEELVDGIAAVHALDWRSAGVEAPAAAEQFLEKQLERWQKVRAADAVRELPLMGAVAGWLREHLPVSRAVTIAHGDFHLDNTLFRRDRPSLAAIIDWELATVGDPLTDLGLMLAFWGPRRVASPGFDFVQQVTRQGIPAPSREELAGRWSRSTGIAIESLDYYVVFALWRLASIVEGAWVLRTRGLVDDEYSRRLEHDVPALFEEAAVIAGLR